MASQRWRRYLFLLPVVLGIAAAFWWVRAREGPQQVPAAAVALTVRTVEVPAVTVVPRAVGIQDGAARPPLGGRG